MHSVCESSVVFLAPLLQVCATHSRHCANLFLLDDSMRTNITGVIVQAAVYGSGCWARNPAGENDVGVACCTTGKKADTRQTNHGRVMGN